MGRVDKRFGRRPAAWTHVAGARGLGRRAGGGQGRGVGGGGGRRLRMGRLRLHAIVPWVVARPSCRRCGHAAATATCNRPVGRCESLCARGRGGRAGHEEGASGLAIAAARMPAVKPRTTGGVGAGEGRGGEGRGGGDRSRYVPSLPSRPLHARVRQLQRCTGGGGTGREYPRLPWPAAWRRSTWWGRAHGLPSG